MKLTNAERVILVMLADIQEKLGIEEGVDSKLVNDAISTDNTWALSWELSSIIPQNDNDTPPEVKEVCNILDMWECLESAYISFNKTEKLRIETEASPFGKDVRFRGFDSHNENTHYSAADFLINKMGRYEHFAGRNLNSHGSSLDVYRRMLEKFKPMSSTASFGPLNVDQVIEVLKAQKHK